MQIIVFVFSVNLGFGFDLIGVVLLFFLIVDVFGLVISW